MEKRSSPVLLLECATDVEATAVRAMLLQHGIETILQTENVSALLPYLQPIMAPRLLVPAADLERAQALLEAQQDFQTSGQPLEGGVCAVHEVQAIAVCARCGSFLCERCGSLGEPPVCESCQEAEKLPGRTSNAQRPALVLLAALLAAGFALYWLARL